MKKGLILAGLIFMVTFCLGLSYSFAQDTIKVGIVLPLTGDQAKFGEIEKQSFDLALGEINAALIWLWGRSMPQAV